jgi:hypothetical protein
MPVGLLAEIHFFFPLSILYQSKRPGVAAGSLGLADALDMKS